MQDDDEVLFVSPFDTRLYAAYGLGNGLEVVLCSDPASPSST